MLLRHGGCETLLIDLDPAAHASNFFSAADSKAHLTASSALAKLFLDIDLEAEPSFQAQLLESAIVQCPELWSPVRPQLSILSGGPELRHFSLG